MVTIKSKTKPGKKPVSRAQERPVRSNLEIDRSHQASPNSPADDRQFDPGLGGWDY